MLLTLFLVTRSCRRSAEANPPYGFKEAFLVATTSIEPPSTLSMLAAASKGCVPVTGINGDALTITELNLNDVQDLTSEGPPFGSIEEFVSGFVPIPTYATEFVVTKISPKEMDAC